MIFSRNIEDVLDQKKKIKIKGVNFIIKKIDALNYLDGSKIMLSLYETYKTGKKHISESDYKKMKDHFRDVLLAGVKSPALSRKDDGSGFFVDKLFNDWEIADGLYNEIVEFTYGKKKLNFFQRKK